eukprot:TRINITY_DN3060_c0_g1_i3.p1 TRINITY_DN3060_c0_g1~~TRINITY_DN3060_c0_g1_i3.p1  ORF type:complete len:276 (-),score=23.96 TRINITY_DN3060_c0_g1_i3:736-1563(-)
MMLKPSTRSAQRKRDRSREQLVSPSDDEPGRRGSESPQLMKRRQRVTPSSLKGSSPTPVYPTSAEAAAAFDATADVLVAPEPSTLTVANAPNEHSTRQSKRRNTGPGKPGLRNDELAVHQMDEDDVALVPAPPREPHVAPRPRNRARSNKRSRSRRPPRVAPPAQPAPIVAPPSPPHSASAMARRLLRVKHDAHIASRDRSVRLRNSAFLGITSAVPCRPLQSAFPSLCKVSAHPGDILFRPFLNGRRQTLWEATFGRLSSRKQPQWQVYRSPSK